jgi:integrase
VEDRAISQESEFESDEPLLSLLKAHRLSPRDLAGGMTEATLGRLPAPPDGMRNYDLPDRGRRAVAGLRILRGKKGITFVFGGSVRQADGKFKSAQITLGRWATDGTGISLAKARELAASKKAEFRVGIDPHAVRLVQTTEDREAEKPITLRVAYELYKAARTGRKKKPLAATTQVEYRRIVETALGAFLDRPLADFGDDPRELVRHFNKVSERTPGEANSQMRVLRAIWTRAHKVMPGKVPAPPAIWDMNEVAPRDAGYVTREVAGLWREIQQLPNAISRKGAIALLLLGLREGALLNMQFDHIDAESRTLLIPKTKGKTLVLPVSEYVCALLLEKLPENLAAPDNPHVFPSLRGPRSSTIVTASEITPWAHVDKLNFKGLTPPAAYVKQRGAAARVHPHVFRHTYRTLATSSGASEVAIRLLMGHSLQGDVSFDYLTADLDWLRQAQEQINAYILEAATEAPSLALRRNARAADR